MCGRDGTFISRLLANHVIFYRNDWNSNENGLFVQPCQTQYVFQLNDSIGHRFICHDVYVISRYLSSARYYQFLVHFITDSIMTPFFLTLKVLKILGWGFPVLKLRILDTQITIDLISEVGSVRLCTPSWPTETIRALDTH